MSKVYPSRPSFSPSRLRSTRKGLAGWMDTKKSGLVSRPTCGLTDQVDARECSKWLTLLCGRGKNIPDPYPAVQVDSECIPYFTLPLLPTVAQYLRVKADRLLDDCAVVVAVTEVGVCYGHATPARQTMDTKLLTRSNKVMSHDDIQYRTTEQGTLWNPVPVPGTVYFRSSRPERKEAFGCLWSLDTNGRAESKKCFSNAAWVFTCWWLYCLTVL